MFPFAVGLFQSDSDFTAFDTLLLIVYCVVIVLMIASLWKIFEKAGKQGWLALIPLANYFAILDIAGRPWWWAVLALIPIVNFIIEIVIMIDIAKKFGESEGFGLGMAFLPFIFWPILAFGDAQYQGYRRNDAYFDERAARLNLNDDK